MRVLVPLKKGDSDDEEENDSSSNATEEKRPATDTTSRKRKGDSVLQKPTVKKRAGAANAVSNEPAIQLRAGASDRANAKDSLNPDRDSIPEETTRSTDDDSSRESPIGCKETKAKSSSAKRETPESTDRKRKSAPLQPNAKQAPSDCATKRTKQLDSTATTVGQTSIAVASTKIKSPPIDVGDRKPPARKMGLYVRDHSPTSSVRTSRTSVSSTDLMLSDEDFATQLKKRGLEIRPQEGDGNCLFRAVSLQVYGDPSMHGQIRNQCMDFMERDQQHFAQFVTGEPFDLYVQRKRRDGVHGNNPEIQAISELFNRPVEVYCPDNGPLPINIFHADYKTGDAPLRLSYHDGNHYNAVVDPLVPTAGLGLGLPGLQPGLADKMQVAKAVAASDEAADEEQLQRVMKKSEDDELQRTIKESSLSVEHMYSQRALNLSDADATYFEMEQAVLEQSLRASQTTSGLKQQANASSRGDSKHRTGESKPPPIVAVAAAPSTGGVKIAGGPRFPSSSSLGLGDFRSQAHSMAPTSSISIPPAAASVASMPSAASAVASLDDASTGTSLMSTAAEEYPAIVQELTMNGFPLQKVIKAYELLGDNFDEMLTFLMGTTS